MNYTEKYHLPQWEETDRIMRVDFNQMCADMEAGLTANKASADSGIADAKAKAAELPYVVGSYYGNGETSREIYLGFRPQFLIICGNAQNTFDSDYCGQGILLVGPNVHSNLVFFTETGFRYEIVNSRFTFPAINESGKPYDYIAFR